MKLLCLAVFQHSPANARLCSTTRYRARTLALTCALTCVLTSALIWPSGVVLAEGIKVEPGRGNTSMGRAGNGVPVVNVATPNGKGVSHNTFRDYNVDRQGAILNNARGKAADTRLGGRISANPNLRDRAAQLIINEVNGGSPSRLKGYTEVAGQQANVVVANPFGITCNGCGFINTPRATLSTGEPVFKDGELDHFAVDQGQVAIEGMGLDASEVDRFDIITRAAKLNAEVHANELNVVAGANDVDADTLATTRRTGTGEAPELAVDSSALGGMYAGSIRLVGTEAGVGVKVAGDMAASSGDIRLDANGQLTLANATSTGRVVARARNANFEGEVNAREAVDVLARERIKVAGTLSSAGDINLSARQVHNSGQILAQEIKVDADQSLNNHAGQLQAEEAFVMTAANLDNTAGTMAGDTIDMVVENRVDNRKGQMAGKRIALATGGLNNTRGLIEADGDLTVDADTLINRKGFLRNVDEAGNGASHVIVADTLYNMNGRLGLGSPSAYLEAGRLVNVKGHVTHAGDGLLTLNAGRLNNTAGRVQGTGRGQVTLGSFFAESPGMYPDPNYGLQFNKAFDLTLVDEPLRVGRYERIATGGDLTLKGPGIFNGGGIIANGNLRVMTPGSFDNDSLITVLGDLRVQANDVHQSGSLENDGDARYLLRGGFHNEFGRIYSGGDLDIDTTYLDNEASIASWGNLTITSRTAIDNYSYGGLSSMGNMTLIARQLFNQGKDILAMGDLTFAGNDQREMADSLENRSGNIEAKGNLSIYAKDIVNTRDEFSASKQRQAVETSVDYTKAPASNGVALYDIHIREFMRTRVNEDSPRGDIVSEGDLALYGKHVINDNGALLSNGDVTIVADKVEHKGFERRPRVHDRHYRVPVASAPGQDNTELMEQLLAFWDEYGVVNSRGRPISPYDVLGEAPYKDVHSPWDDGEAPYSMISAQGKVTIDAADALLNAEVHENTHSRLTLLMGDHYPNEPVSPLSLSINRLINGVNSHAAEPDGLLPVVSEGGESESVRERASV